METKAWPSQGDNGHLAPPDGLCTGKACDCGRVPCGMYLFDHRMGEHEVCTGWGGCLTLRQWFVYAAFGLFTVPPFCRAPIFYFVEGVGSLPRFEGVCLHANTVP